LNDKNKPKINEAIRASKVNLISSSGENRGLVSLSEALAEAVSESLDLVEVSGSSDQIVCRIMDYGKHIFDANKKKKQSTKDKNNNDIKEVRLRPAIDKHDLQIKSNKVRKFLESGKKVKIDIRLKGRERRHPELAQEVVDRFVATLEDISKLESKGNSYMLIPTGK